MDTKNKLLKPDPIGSRDDTARIQKILDANRICRLARGHYRITDTLVLRRGSGIVGGG